MAWSRKTLTQLISDATADIASAIPGADALLRFANLNILAKIMAGLAHLHYGYQDWIALMAVPFTATGEFLEGWAALKKVTRKPATQWTGTVSFTDCTPGREIVGETPLVRGDGVAYTAISGVVIDGSGNATLPVIAVIAGQNGNCADGIILTLGIAIAGVQSSAPVASSTVEGQDLETDASFYNRMLLAYQNPPQGGASGDYPNWALALSGVTRAWTRPNGLGAGTVIVYFMMDDVESAFGGFPQGTNGVATNEPRAAPATGDQLEVANGIFPLQPVTALVYAFAPTPNSIDFSISGISGVSSDVKAAIQAAIDDVFFRLGSPGGVYLSDGSTGGTVDLSDLESAIAAVAGTEGFVIDTPSGNISSSIGALPVRGTITYT